jgi:hypothetical protein
LLVSAAGAITLGCGDGDAMSAPQGDVEGTYINTYLWETGETTAPRTDITVAAIVPQPDGPMKTIDGEVRDDGSFRIEDPGQSYYLKVSGTDEDRIPSFFWTRERAFKLG